MAGLRRWSEKRLVRGVFYGAGWMQVFGGPGTRTFCCMAFFRVGAVQETGETGNASPDVTA